MELEEKLMFEGWATLPQFKKKVDQAKLIIKEALQIAPAYVAVSWGKDSVVLAHLAISITNIPLIHVSSDERDLIDNYSEVESSFLLKFGCNYRKYNLKLKNASETFNQLSASLPNVALIGVRAEESSKRRIAIRKNGLIYNYKNTNKYRVFPLSWWSWKDIWSYIVVNDLPYLRSYDHHLNNGKDLSRTSVHIGRRRGEEFGRFERLKAMNMSYYNLLFDCHE